MSETKYVSSDNLAYYDALVKNRDAQKADIPTKLSELGNDANYVADASYTHTDSNFTAAEKTKLAGVAEGAQANAIDAITVNGAAASISNKTVNITVPTDNKDIANGAGYQTAANVKTTVEGYGYQTASQVAAKGYQTAANVKSTVEGYGYQTSSQVESAIAAKGYQTASQVEAAVAAAVGKVTSITYSVVESLPTTGEAGVIYLLSNGGAENQNLYDEYIWLGSKYEKLGTKELDLSGYVKTGDLVAMTTAEIDALFA